MTQNRMRLSTREAVPEGSACGLFQCKRFGSSLPAAEFHDCAPARAGLSRIDIETADPTFCALPQQLTQSFRDEVKPTGVGGRRVGVSRANGGQMWLVHPRVEPRYWGTRHLPKPFAVAVRPFDAQFTRKRRPSFCGHDPHCTGASDGAWHRRCAAVSRRR